MSTRGFKHTCPFCGAEDGLRVHLADVHQLVCQDCDADITADEIRVIIGQWHAVLAWLDSAPMREDG